jgi:outer membrane autotransporter protein
MRVRSSAAKTRYPSRVSAGAPGIEERDAKRVCGVAHCFYSICLGLLFGLCAATETFAQTYNQTIDSLLGISDDALCAGLDLDPPGNVDGLGSELSTICTVPGGNATPSGSSSSAGSAASTVQFAALIVQERLRTAREAEGEQGGTGGGASSDTVVDLGGGFGVFFSAGYESLNKNNNRFEDGYDSDIVNTTAGVDYKISDWLVAGVAFNYSNFDGSYDNGGGFDTNSYGGLFYASVLPTERSFVDVTLGYARQDYDQKQNVSWNDEFGRTFAGRVKGDYDGNEFSAGFLSGYDFPIDNFTIGPRLGVNWIRVDQDGYDEKGSTGLELAVNSNTQTSVQSSLGFLATAAFSTDFGVLVPQFGASWIHEYAEVHRNVKAHFVQDNRPDPTTFTYKREKPVRDWGDLSLGVSAVLPNGLQPFANFGTMVGNGRFTSYAGTLGMRADW